MTRNIEASVADSSAKAIRRTVLAIATTVMLASGAQANDSPYNPHHGPYTEPIASVATWKVRQGYLSLEPSDTTRLMEEWKNPGIVNSWLFGPENLDPWFAIIHYEPTGHVPDDDKIDAEAIMVQLKEGSALTNEERRKRGWPELTLLGWQVAPHYESDTKRLAWATLSETNGRKVVNYTTKLLSRTGVATVVLVVNPEQFDRSVTELKAQLDQFSFNPDQTYNQFRSGDKIAEYGLTGLIVGGAAAAAIKTGAWKWLVGLLAAGWKFVAAGAFALLAAVRSLFKRRSA